MSALRLFITSKAKLKKRCERRWEDPSVNGRLSDLSICEKDMAAAAAAATSVAAAATAAHGPASLCSLRNLSALTADERDRYLSCVYGEGMRGATAVWEEDPARVSQGVVWRSFLPLRLQQQCRWPQLPVAGAGSVYDVHGSIPLMGDSLLGVYGHEGLCYGAAANEGGHRRPPRRLDGDDTWVEVVHRAAVGGATDNPTSRLERQALWMYAARGSGLWYRTGATLVMSDTIDLVHALNFTTLTIGHDAPPHFVSKPRLLRLARSRLRADTVIFTHHVDNRAEVRATGSCHGSVYKREVVGLRPTTVATASAPRACPPDPRNMARGWRGENRSCFCDVRSLPMVRCTLPGPRACRV